MDNNLSIVFAVILLLGGGLIVGKTLVSRNKSATPAISCPSTTLLKLTPEVQAYIEQKLPVATNQVAANEQMYQTVIKLETEVQAITDAYAKSKQFIFRAETLEKRMTDVVKTRGDRLEKGRMRLGEGLVNRAAAKCGKPGDIFYKPKGPVTPPPQPNTSK